MDKVDPKALKKNFKDRKDKDIDNDGDVDSSDEYLHNRRKAVSKAITKEANGEEEGEEDPKKKKPFPPKKDGEEKDVEDEGEGEEEEDEEEGEEEEKPVPPKKDDKKKPVAASPKTAEISKIGEATEELIDMLETVAKQQKSNALPPEGLTDKESKGAKDWIAKHKVEVTDEEPTHETATKAGRATTAKSGKRPQDNASGDTKVVNPVKEATVVDADAKKGSVSLVDMAREQLSGEAKKEDKPSYDGRYKEAKAFIERMAKRRGYVKKDNE